MEFSRTIRRPGNVTIGYRVLRTRTPRPLLVMIHGLASNNTRWSEFVDHTILAPDNDLMRIDLRGHGDSMFRGHITTADWVDDLAAILRDEGYDKATIVGHSLGAQVGMHFHAKYPSNVRAMIMIDPVFPDNLSGRLLKAKKLRVFIWLAVRLLRIVNGLGLRRKKFPPRDLRALDEQTREILDNNPDIAIGDLYTNPFVDLEFMPVANYMQDTLEVIKPVPPLENIDVPVLVLLSSGASISNPEKNQATINRMPNARIVNIAANHWLLTEKPREAREAIEKWYLGLPLLD
ncbi:MAG: alpha/beta fold hydrolase [Acidiferrobacterales bacterium]